MIANNATNVQLRGGVAVSGGARAVLAVTRQLGQHNLTEQEIHEVYTAPLMQKQAEVMGMQIVISPWQADGWVTMTVKAPEKVAAR